MLEANATERTRPTFKIVVERRAWVRQPSSQQTLCQANTAQLHDIWLLARIRELSAAGIGLDLTHPFEPGTVLSIEPIQAGPGLGRRLEARVINVRRGEPLGWIIGCEFTSRLSEEELQALL